MLILCALTITFALADRPHLARKLAFAQPQHYTLDWPRAHFTDEQLGKPGMELHLGNQVLQQLFSVDMLHLILDNLRGLRLPLDELPIVLPPTRDTTFVGKQLKNRAGQVVMSVSNIRIHRARISGLQGIDKKLKIVDREDGSFFVDSKNKPKGEAKARFANYTTPNMFYKMLRKPAPRPVFRDAVNKTPQEQILIRLREDHANIEIKGLSFELTCEYDMYGIEGYAHDINFNQKGQLWLRAVDAVLLMKTDLVQDELLGYPTVHVRPNPELKWGKLQIRFDKTPSDDMYSYVAKLFIKYLKTHIAQMTAAVLMDQVPIVSGIVGDLIDTAIHENLNSQLLSLGLPVTEIPELVVQDLRWRVHDYRIVIGCNLLYVDQFIRDQLKVELERMKREFGSEPGQIAEQRARLMNTLKRWRPEDKKTWTDRVGGVVGGVGNVVGGVGSAISKILPSSERRQLARNNEMS